ncbi:hypothetical protein [Flagellimonas meishanensis]|uniref:hypothetical protein n=1 Tax=Flagellimonas meishanensis TaxID=2873264 RepID=UPI001CA71544|nr:hypothetical protein [[Muricauda] meishanensis]
MVFGIIILFFAVVGLITLLRPIMYKKTKIPLDRIRTELQRNGLTIENYKEVEKADRFDINFENDINPFNNPLFYGVGFYEIIAKNKDGGISTLYAKWYQSHGFPFKDKLYFKVMEFND